MGVQGRGHGLARDTGDGETIPDPGKAPLAQRMLHSLLLPWLLPTSAPNKVRLLKLAS